MSLPLGPLGKNYRMVCVDMQNLFIEPGTWFCDSGRGIMETCQKLISIRPERCLFTRHIPPENPEDARGSWQVFYRHWSNVVLNTIERDRLNLHPSLSTLAKPELIFDKPAYSAFSGAEFSEYVNGVTGIELIIFGLETDVCVLSTILDAVDLGIRTIVPVDAVASGCSLAHQATLKTILPRNNLQIELCKSEDLIPEMEML